MAGENGEVTEPLIDIYRNLAKSGVGLIITSYTFVTKKCFDAILKEGRFYCVTFDKTGERK